MLKFKRNMGLGFLVVLIAIGSFASYAFAEKDEEWIADKKRLEYSNFKNTPEDEECKIVWDILWSWAKKGNLEARANLFFYSFPAAAHAPVIYLPGSDDELSRRRNTIILGIHSYGVLFDDSNIQETYKKISDIAYNLSLNDQFEGKHFLECMRNNPKKDDCIRYAKGRLVPSFDKYAEEIDALIKAGMKPQCFLRNEH